VVQLLFNLLKLSIKLLVKNKLIIKAGVGKPGSVPWVVPRWWSFLSGRELPLCLKAAYPSLWAGHPWLCLAFLQAGVTVPSPVTRACGGLLPHLFTLALTPKIGAVGGLFSVALSRDYSLRVLPGALPYGARTFLTGRQQTFLRDHLPTPANNIYATYKKIL